ncbi:hypothetical protein L1049_011180 [Liquidambar formosana]|uniref:Reverse transcriptase domain-containing protein n=1 Tax=Liquidambar formosana TaxID=63359 RepID=A0AAP0X2I1_LIQFO
MLTAFGFDAIFVNWVSSILHSAKLSVLVNGSLFGFFGCSRGVRQGDHLSPLLFCLAEDVLSQGHSLMMQNDLLAPISSPRGYMAPTHILFADDILIFCKRTRHNFSNLLQFLEMYKEASGQQISEEKSAIFFSQGCSCRKDAILSSMGFKEGKLPFTYLGVPLFKGWPRRIYLQHIADCVKAKLTVWKESLLSMAGQVQLVTSVIHSMLLHSFSIYLWPSSLIRQLQTWIRNFIWSGNADQKKLIIVAWSRTCALKDEGGIGVHDLKTLNHALMLKLA